MIKIAICDDEKPLRSQLQEVVERDLQLQGLEYEIIEFESGESLLSGNHLFDILFLDIEMNALNGIETAKSLRQNGSHAVIIFITSYPDFVFQGYEVRALNYILKPYKDDKIAEVLKAALAESGRSIAQHYIVEQKSGTTKLPLKDILYFFSDKRNITVACRQGTTLFYGQLSQVETEVPDFFVRIHNRYLVNLNYVDKIETSSVLCGEHILPVSRSCKQDLMTAFAKFIVR